MAYIILPRSYRRTPPFTRDFNRESGQANSLVGWWPLRNGHENTDLIVGRRLDLTGVPSTAIGGRIAYRHSQADASNAGHPEMDGSCEKVTGFYWRGTGFNGLSTLSSCTVAFWGWCPDGGTPAWVGVGTGSGGLQFYSAGISSFLVAVHRASDGGALVSSGLGFANGFWRHIAYSNDGTTNRIYVNGIEAANNTTAWDTGAISQVGVYGNPHNTYPDLGSGVGARVTDLRIYSRALSATEILNIADYPTRWDLYLTTPRRLYFGAAAAGGGAITGTASLLESNDTLSSAVTAVVSANAALQESNDALVSVSTVAVTGTAAIQEASDALTSSVTVAFPATTATAALYEANDTLVSAASVVLTGTASLAEANDALTSAGAVAITASASLREANDTLAADGGTATFAIAAMTERDDALTATGTVLVTGTAAISEASDVLASAATVSITATAALQEANDLLTAAGSVGTVVRTADAALQEANDTLAATAVSAISASAAIIEAGDIVVSGVTVVVTANAALVEANDGLTAAGTALFGAFADAALQEANDTLTSAVVQKIARRIAASDALRGGIAASDAGRWSITSSDGLN